MPLRVDEDADPLRWKSASAFGSEAPRTTPNHVVLSERSGMMPIMPIDFEAELWEHDGKGAWCFVTVPPEPSEDIRFSGAMPAGFGSYKVEATAGATTWQTSVFPDSASGGFVLPVKKAVRRAEALDVGDVVRVSLEVLGSA